MTTTNDDGCASGCLAFILSLVILVGLSYWLTSMVNEFNDKCVAAGGTTHQVGPFLKSLLCVSPDGRIINIP